MSFGGVFASQDGINAGRHCREATTTLMRYRGGSPESSGQDMTSLVGWFVVAEMAGTGEMTELSVLSSQYVCSCHEKAINHCSVQWGAVDGGLI